VDFVAVAAFYLFIYVFAHGGVLSALFLLYWLWGGCSAEIACAFAQYFDIKTL